MAVIKSWVKFWLYAMLAGYAWVRIRLNRKPALIILTYHRVLPDGDPRRNVEQPGMVVSPAAFRQHLEAVQRMGAEFVHLDEWLRKSESGEALPRLAVAVTFDDGWRDNYEYAYPILKKFSAPGVIFLVSGLVGTERIFWPEQVMELLTRSSLPRNEPVFDWLRACVPALADAQDPLSHEQADQAVNQLKQLEDETIEANLAAIYKAFPELRPAQSQRAILNVDEIHEMRDSGLMRFGAHTRNHYRLNRLGSDEALQVEIVGSQRDLIGYDLQPVQLFCYPNGNITARGEALVAEHYLGACTTETGWNTQPCKPHLLRRFNLHDGNAGSPRNFFATLGRGLR